MINVTVIFLLHQSYRQRDILQCHKTLHNIVILHYIIDSLALGDGAIICEISFLILLDELNSHMHAT